MYSFSDNYSSEPLIDKLSKTFINLFYLFPRFILLAYFTGSKVVLCIVISETWLRPYHPFLLAALLYRLTNQLTNDRTLLGGGGVCIYLHNNIRAIIIK